MINKKIALVTGAKRGLGFATSEALAEMGYTVILVGRGKKEIEAQAEILKTKKLDVVGFYCDITKDSDVSKLKSFVAENFGKLDVLVNNAGVFNEVMGESSVFTTTAVVVKETFETNTLGTFRVMNALSDLLKKSNEAQVVNVSSGMGQLSEMNGAFPGYRLSKTAMNALTKIYAEEFGDTVKVNSICPGWVKTEMGGAGAERTIPEGIKGIVWAATLPANGPTGGFYRDGERLDW
ncbi:MAG: SDR family NAD(P)-dependent oxidoreductase [Xanthomonadaceae bacterium]|nr:SDR family NAD(P)-dependent oxidoreductase [Xanthomonadaceae bacterium]